MKAQTHRPLVTEGKGSSKDKNSAGKHEGITQITHWENIHTREQQENTVYKADVNVKNEQEAILLFRTVYEHILSVICGTVLPLLNMRDKANKSN